MKIDFTTLKEVAIPKMNGGEGVCKARMYMDESGKIIYSILPKGSSIGLHLQKASNDVNYVISGQGKAVCAGVDETLKPGDCHYCPKGSVHSIINTGEDDLVLFSVVTEL
ncbi:MAG: cupin domain-containing protein [Prevotella sp.]|nr:cupin domain-containing protein [Prevotella sp.]